MAQGSYRTTCGARRRYYVFAHGMAQGSADTASRKPGVALTLREYGKNGERTERAVEQTALAA